MRTTASNWWLQTAACAITWPPSVVVFSSSSSLPWSRSVSSQILYQSCPSRAEGNQVVEIGAQHNMRHGLKLMLGQHPGTCNLGDSCSIFEFSALLGLGPANLPYTTLQRSQSSLRVYSCHRAHSHQVAHETNAAQRTYHRDTKISVRSLPSRKELLSEHAPQFHREVFHQNGVVFQNQNQLMAKSFRIAFSLFHSIQVGKSAANGAVAV